MPVVVALLRAVNVGGRSSLKMEKLRELCESLGLQNPRTYVQSGNIVFKTRERDLAAVASRIADGIGQTMGFRPDVIYRSVTEMRDVIARNPFAERTDVGDSRLLVTFFADDPGEEARAAIRALRISPEEMFIEGREMYVYYPNGAGRSKFPASTIDRALKMRGTARNWTTVKRLLEMAENA